MDGYKHYIRLDVNNFIIKRFSDAFEQPLETDILVAIDAGRHYNDPVANERGQYIAKWVDGAEVARTQTELDAEWDARPVPPDPDEELSEAIQAAIQNEPVGSPIRKLGEALLGNGTLARVKGKMK